MTTSPGAQSLPRECARVPVRFLPACRDLAACCALAAWWAFAVCPAEATGLIGVGAALDAVG